MEYVRQYRIHHLPEFMVSRIVIINMTLNPTVVIFSLSSLLMAAYEITVDERKNIFLLAFYRSRTQET